MFTITRITSELLASGSTTTVSNTGGAWCLVAAPTCGEYRTALDAVPRVAGGLLRSTELCSVQMRMSARYESVQPTWCIRGAGYWYLRNTSNLGNTFPAGRGQYSMLEECLEAGVAWHAKAPEYREVVVHTTDVRTAGLAVQE
jgi:hypothetical protein